MRRWWEHFGTRNGTVSGKWRRSGRKAVGEWLEKQSKRGGQLVGKGDGTIAQKSSSESDDECALRKRTPVKTLALDNAPAPGLLRAWKGALYVKSCTASNRSRKRTIRYLNQVESCTDVLLSKMGCDAPFQRL